jgi:hypothetical protein
MAANWSAWRRGYLPEMTRIRKAGGTRFHITCTATNHRLHGHVDPPKPVLEAAMLYILGGGSRGRHTRLRRCAGIRNKTVDTMKLEDKLVQIVRINVVAGFIELAWQCMSDMVQYAVLEGGGQSI